MVYIYIYCTLHAYVGRPLDSLVPSTHTRERFHIFRYGNKRKRKIANSLSLDEIAIAFTSAVESASISKKNDMREKSARCGLLAVY